MSALLFLSPGHADEGVGVRGLPVVEELEDVRCLVDRDGSSGASG
jgi:hypothetical protein